MVEGIRAAGCPIDESFFFVVDCGEKQIGGAFAPGSGVRCCVPWSGNHSLLFF
jgi:hypothetical protein